MWAVRDETNQNGSFLSHYGVKGMKWGVRKEKETFNKNNRSTASNLVDLNDKDTWGYNPGEPSDKASDYAMAASVNKIFISKMESSRAFNEYLNKEMGLTGAVKMAKDYSTASTNYYQALISNDSKGSAKWEAEVIRIGQKMDRLITEYERANPSGISEEELATAQTWGQMVDTINGDEFSEVLANGSTITMEQWWDGEKYVPKYIFRGRDGTVQSFNFGEEDALKAYAANEKNKKIDFRDTTKGRRTREKNVDSNTKPVSIKKGEKISVSEKERQFKAQQSPAAAKTQRELLTIGNLKGRYGENAIKRNKIIRDANLQRNSKKLETGLSSIKPNVKVSALSKIGDTVKSGTNSVKKYMNQIMSSSSKKFDGRSFIEKIFNIRKGKNKIRG